MVEERYGKLAAANILTSIWIGDWERYHKIFEEVSDEAKEGLYFHRYYKGEDVQLWHDNHFSIPGEHFIPPYISSYSSGADHEDSRRNDLLCLVGLYEKMQFYYPLEINMYPDHFGCLTAFLGALLQEEIKAEEAGEKEYLEKLENMEEEFVQKYLKPVLPSLLKLTDLRVKHLFFREFLKFYEEFVELAGHTTAVR
ncbi:molecular chaperone TorD family protein [Mesobacillus zeae]|uniref:Molecular chaperone TorD n=1 Tax=Mesobacillus zeae TaxID=1917180 RepID=A0A398B2Z9_9BACI|nr:molecular chaperone TorD family protein [Mesobacillus zeae]RID82330.1 hypothetical protein D1970_19365 [Mesobacillus zeae]